MDPQKEMLKEIQRSPAYQFLQENRFNEASIEAQRIMSEGEVRKPWVDGNVWNVSPLIYRVKQHGEKLSCPCSFFNQWGFCAHTLVVDLARK